jgi:DNA-binding transcriptional ArsR family regulator
LGWLSLLPVDALTTLAHASRFTLFAAIVESDGSTVRQLADRFNVTRTVVGYHLHLLRAAGVVRADVRPSGCAQLRVASSIGHVAHALSRANDEVFACLRHPNAQDILAEIMGAENRGNGVITTDALARLIRVSEDEIYRWALRHQAAGVVAFGPRNTLVVTSWFRDWSQLVSHAYGSDVDTISS